MRQLGAALERPKNFPFQRRPARAWAVLGLGAAEAFAELESSFEIVLCGQRRRNDLLASCAAAV